MQREQQVNEKLKELDFYELKLKKVIIGKAPAGAGGRAAYINKLSSKISSIKVWLAENGHVKFGEK